MSMMRSCRFDIKFGYNIDLTRQIKRNVKKLKKRYLIGGGIIVLAIAYLITLTLGNSVSYYLTVSELMSKSNDLHDTRVRVIGNIVDNSVEWNAEDVELRFAISEGGETLPVVYNGARPAGFEPGSDILVEGKLQSDKVFLANQLIMRCPSKYEP
jgi:cytochrome c-type biogenesis protein CcmE